MLGTSRKIKFENDFVERWRKKLAKLSGSNVAVTFNCSPGKDSKPSAVEVDSFMAAFEGKTGLSIEGCNLVALGDEKLAEFLNSIATHLTTFAPGWQFCLDVKTVHTFTEYLSSSKLNTLDISYLGANPDVAVQTLNHLPGTINALAVGWCDLALAIAPKVDMAPYSANLPSKLIVYDDRHKGVRKYEQEEGNETYQSVAKHLDSFAHIELRDVLAHPNNSRDFICQAIGMLRKVETLTISTPNASANVRDKSTCSGMILADWKSLWVAIEQSSIKHVVFDDCLMGKDTLDGAKEAGLKTLTIGENCLVVWVGQNRLVPEKVLEPIRGIHLETFFISTEWFSQNKYHRTSCSNPSWLGAWAADSSVLEMPGFEGEIQKGEYENSSSDLGNGYQMHSMSRSEYRSSWHPVSQLNFMRFLASGGFESYQRALAEGTQLSKGVHAWGVFIRDTQKIFTEGTRKAPTYNSAQGQRLSGYKYLSRYDEVWVSGEDSNKHVRVSLRSREGMPELAAFLTGMTKPINLHLKLCFTSAYSYSSNPVAEDADVFAAKMLEEALAMCPVALGVRLDCFGLAQPYFDATARASKRNANIHMIEVQDGHVVSLDEVTDKISQGIHLKRLMLETRYVRKDSLVRFFKALSTDSAFESVTLRHDRFNTKMEFDDSELIGLIDTVKRHPSLRELNIGELILSSNQKERIWRAWVIRPDATDFKLKLDLGRKEEVNCYQLVAAVNPNITEVTLEKPSKTLQNHITENREVVQPALERITTLHGGDIAKFMKVEPEFKKNTYASRKLSFAHACRLLECGQADKVKEGASLMRQVIANTKNVKQREIVEMTLADRLSRHEASHPGESVSVDAPMARTRASASRYAQFSEKSYERDKRKAAEISEDTASDDDEWGPSRATK